MFSKRNSDTKAVLIGGICILLVGGVFLFQKFWNNSLKNQSSDGASSEAAKEETGKVPMITAEAVRQKIINREKIRLLDVRDQESFKIEHIPRSFSLSPSALDSFLPEQDELVVVIFSSQDTKMLEIVENSLKQKSSARIFLLEGGFEGWKKGGNQTISIGDPKSFIDQSKVTYISQSEFLNIQEDVFLLDVQSEQNYQKKHIKGSKNIPLDQLEKRFEEIPPATIVIVYGESEYVSFRGAVRLYDLNIFSAKALSGNNHLTPESIFLLEP